MIYAYLRTSRSMYYGQKLTGLFVYVFQMHDERGTASTAHILIHIQDRPAKCVVKQVKNTHTHCYDNVLLHTCINTCNYLHTHTLTYSDTYIHRHPSVGFSCLLTLPAHSLLIDKYFAFKDFSIVKGAFRL